jgi:monofunctional biosynthetic peptidoglycan transglycosylase
MSLRRLIARAVWRLILLGLLVVAALQLWYFARVAYWRWENPSQTAFMQRELERLRQKDPRAQLRHQWVPYARISNYLKRAVVAAEDARFTQHEGVDWDAIEKAYAENLKRGRPARGGSTISQQLAKNLLLSSEKSYARKAQELVITWMIELAWDKRRILEVYLNVVEWGEGVFGAEAAARHYYGISADRLGPEQSARLAAYLPNPKRYGRIRSGPFLDRRTEDILRDLYSVPIP